MPLEIPNALTPVRCAVCGVELDVLSNPLDKGKVRGTCTVKVAPWRRCGGALIARGPSPSAELRSAPRKVVGEDLLDIERAIALNEERAAREFGEGEETP